MSLNKLSEVEAFRAQVLLEEALRKLSFLTSISSSASVHGDELTQFMGDEISRIIQEQRDLERKYEERIAARGQLKGLCNKAKFMETQREIQEVAHKLKESNKSLCRNLKENPNVQGNLIKMQQERWQVTEWLEETKKELGEMSFAILVSKVEQERREQERLSEVKRKEQKNSQAVKDLEDDLQRERSDHEKETKIANQEIKELKEELQKNKTISDIEYKFEEKKLSAREKALLRIHDQMLQKLEKEEERLKQAQDMETQVHERAHAFLDQRIKHLYDENIAWTKDHEKEVDNRTVELDMLKERRAAAHQELAELEERRGLEADSYKEKENEMRNAVLVEKQRREQYQRMAEAVLFLQEEGRNYMARLDARRAAMKGKQEEVRVEVRLSRVRVFCHDSQYWRWSPSFTTAAISRQQGADLAEAAIIAAINSPSIEQLEQVLRASKGIEFQDYKYVHEARALLLRLREVKNDLADAMKARFPEQLREALQAAIDAKLQGIDKARSLLDKLDLVVERLDTAKGLTPLKAAIEAAETARLPEEIIVVGRERLIRREAAQQGLEEAIEAARVPDLLEALKAAEGMDLPAEPEARERVELLGQTQGALQKAMSTKVIPDLSAALTLASKAGLKEHQMIHEARSLLSKLMNRRENVKKELEKAVKFRHPVKLKMTIMSARLAQVSLKRILDAELLEAMADAAGIEEREKTLADAVAYSIPAELLKRFEIELEELKALHDAIRHGDPEVLRECIEKCEDLGIKVVELLEARVLYRDWEAACRKIDVEASVQRVEPLRAAIKAAKDLGVNALVLARGNELLRHLEKRIRMEQELGEALKVRKLEIIASAVRAAGDAGAHDHSLVTRSHDMLEVLQTKRDKLQAASERAELHLMHETLNTVVQSPALPDSETSRAFLKLRALRKKEQIQIVSRLKLAQEILRLSLLIAVTNAET
ncbi:DRC9 [Symbiodinium necroappetens]|uniref:DRC9 protein n=1 Tax=Symbiodinium necroappetens TaxID=1628268 RepID=A0A812K0J9_9DINO|nr:DRC9 [Symbiodinium necroappetens]